MEKSTCFYQDLLSSKAALGIFSATDQNTTDQAISTWGLSLLTGVTSLFLLVPVFLENQKELQPGSSSKRSAVFQNISQDESNGKILLSDARFYPIRKYGQIRYVSSLIESNSNVKDSYALARSIVAQSKIADIHPFLIASIIKAESTFNKKARSRRGALGLMQILPNTGRYISQKEDLHWKGAKKLHDVHYNLQLGIAYLRYLSKAFNGDLEKVLIAYNWGPSNLRSAIKNGKHIPSSTRNYAKKVLKNFVLWQTDFHNSQNKPTQLA